MRWRIALLLGMVVLGALLLEAVARHLCRTDEQRRERLLVGDDYWVDRWLAAESAPVDRTSRRADEPGPLSPGDALHRYDERLGWVPRENVRRDGLSTNALGLRGAREFPFEKPAGERRIVVVGDSFTFGDGVKDEEVWTEKLAQKLAPTHGNVAVLNLGVPGYGLDQHCLRLEEPGIRFSPDLVLVGLFGPDVDRNELTVRDAPKPRFLLDGDGLRLDNVPVPTAEELRRRVEKAAIGSYAWAMFRKMWVARTAEGEDAVKWELARRILDRMRSVSEAGGARFAVAYFPAKGSSFRRDADAYERTVVAWAVERGVPLVNVREAFVALGQNRFREVWHNHWTPFGNEVVADALLAGFREFGVLPR
jgi:hypothetical protein